MIVNKKSIAETFNNFLSILVPTLHRKSNNQNIRVTNIKKESNKFIFSERRKRI